MNYKMNYKKTKSTIALIVIINGLYLLSYSSMRSNDINAFFLSFLNPFVSSIILYWKVNNQKSFSLKKLCYYELVFYFIYFLTLILLSNLRVINIGYYSLTIFFILMSISIFSLFFFIIDFLKKN